MLTDEQIEAIETQIEKHSDTIEFNEERIKELQDENQRLGVMIDELQAKLDIHYAEQHANDEDDGNEY